MSSGMSSRNGGGSGCRLLLVHLPLPLTAQSCLLKYEELYVGSFPLSLQVRCGLYCEHCGLTEVRLDPPSTHARTHARTGRAGGTIVRA